MTEAQWIDWLDKYDLETALRGCPKGMLIDDCAACRSKQVMRIRVQLTIWSHEHWVICD